MNAAPPSEVSRYALAGFMIVAGIMHFVVPRFYERLIPEALGEPRRWVTWSGVAEIVVGILTAVRPTRRVGAWGTLVVLVLVYPGNLKMALDAGAPTDAESWAAWVRLPLQVPLWWWAWRHTRPADIGSAQASSAAG